MATKLVFYSLLYLVLISVLISCVTQKKGYVNIGGTVPQKNAALKINVQDYIKHYTVCTCVELSYKRDSINVNEGSAIFLKEMGDDVITLVTDSIIKKEVVAFVFKNQSGFKHVDGIGKNKMIADCIFFSETTKIKLLAKQLAKKIKHLEHYW